MERIRELLKRPVVLAISCLAMGAGVAVLALGLPGFASPTTGNILAAAGIVATIAIAAYEIARKNRASERSEATRTTALAAALRPFLVEYGNRIQRAQALTCAIESEPDRQFYASTLAVSLTAREELSVQGQRFNVPGLGHLLDRWRDAEPELVGQVARLSAAFQTIAAGMRRPLEEAPERERQFDGAFEFLDAFHTLLDDTAGRLNELQARCDDMTTPRPQR